MPSPANRRNTPVVSSIGLGAALAFLASEASAAIVYTDPTPDLSATGACFNSNAAIAFNPITGETVTGARTLPIAFNGGFNTSVELRFGATASDITRLEYTTTAVANGTLLSSSSTWTSTNATTPNSSIATIGTGVADTTTAFYIGYRFQTSASSDYYYGWAEIEGGGSGSNRFSGLNAFAYENTGNQGITVGAIPEPGITAALFGLAALGLIGFRRLRRRA